MITKKQLLSMGKTKRLWSTDVEGQAIAEFVDDAVMYHGKHKLYFDGKGKLCNAINAILMTELAQNNVPTHFVSLYDEVSSVVYKAEMIPIEVIVYNYTSQSMAKRLGLVKGQKLKFPVLEFCYKNDELDDPVINEYHALAMGLCTQEEMAAMCYQATRINKVLGDLLAKADMTLADFKVEFGRVNGRLLVADEITPNTARLWDRQTLGHICNCGERDAKHEYEQILSRLQAVIK